MGARSEQDYAAWASEQAELLRQSRLAEVDIANLVEELEDVGKSERRELRNRLILLFQHLLRWQFQPDRRGASWHATIRLQRFAIEEHLEENPSLRPPLSDVVFVARAYRESRLAAVADTGLDFPEEPPFLVTQALDSEFLPA